MDTAQLRIPPQAITRGEGLHYPTPISPPPPPPPPPPLFNNSTTVQSQQRQSKVKDLSHVPCKFYKANSCTAGSACPFSHDTNVAGQSKPICQWFAKGNCKFGHKCALAHVLPGQPMSFDRKNKRAAQAALREAQANGVVGTGTDGGGGGIVNMTNAIGQQVGPSFDSNGGLGEVPGRIGGGGEAARAFMMGGSNGGESSSGTSQHGDVEAMFGSPDSVGGGQHHLRTPASSPGLQHRTLPHPLHDSPHSPLSFASIVPPQPPLSHLQSSNNVVHNNNNHNPIASGLSHHLGSMSLNGNNGRSSVAAQAMLSEQARRLSNTSLSPPRPLPPQQAYSHRSFSEFTSTSVPLAVPGPSSNFYSGGGGGGSTTSIFGTSPFSGSRGLFIPSSYDSNEDAFPRSPPNHHITTTTRPVGMMQRSNSNNNGWPSSYRSESALDDGEDGIVDDGNEEGEGEEGSDGDYDEGGFLPSSLNDLLTPEEMRRRTLKSTSSHGYQSSGGLLSSGSPSSFDPFFPSQHHHQLPFPSQSVPIDLLLSSNKPPSISNLIVPPHPPPMRSVSSTTTPTTTTMNSSSTKWGSVDSSKQGQNPTASIFTMPSLQPSASSLLPTSRTGGAGGGGLRSIYSSSYNPDESFGGILDDENRDGGSKSLPVGGLEVGGSLSNRLLHSDEPASTTNGMVGGGGGGSTNTMTTTMSYSQALGSSSNPRNTNSKKNGDSSSLNGKGTSRLSRSTKEDKLNREGRLGGKAVSSTAGSTSGGGDDDLESSSGGGLEDEIQFDMDA